MNTTTRTGFLVLAVLALGAGIPTSARAGGSDSSRGVAKGYTRLDTSRIIATRELPDPDTQTEPMPIWVRPDSGILMEFPIPVLNLYGRGFRIITGDEKDTGNVASEWVLVTPKVPAGIKSVADIPGPYTIFAIPNVEPSARILNVTLVNGKVYTLILQTPLRIKDANGKNSGLELAVARLRFTLPTKRRPSGLGQRLQQSAGAGAPAPGPGISASAQSQGGGSSTQSGGGAMVSDSDSPQPPGGRDLPQVKRVEQPPGAMLRASTPSLELGMVSFLRMLVALPRPEAVRAASQSDVFQSQEKKDEYDFGEYNVRVAWAVRDTTTNAIGLALMVTNRTTMQMAFEAPGWVVRVGERLYRPTTVKGGLAVDPGATVPVFLVIGIDQDTGRPLDLDVRNEFQPSGRIAGLTSARPFRSFNVQLP